MMEENGLQKGWVETTLGEVATYINRGITPKYTEDKGMYILNQRCIRDRKVSYENSRFNNSDLRKVPFDKIVQELDVLICSTGVGTLGRVAQIKKVKEPTTVDSHVTIIRPNNDVDKLYLGHLLGGKEREIEHLAEGSTGQTELPRKKLEVFPILIPKSIPEQKATASILTSFDDKIELLQAQNETLENIAQTIFKEWFGKYQVGDELPEGWRVGKLEEVIEFINGYGFKSKELLNEPELNCLKVFKMGDIKKGGGFNPNKTRSYFKRDDAENLSKFILRNGDILMSMTDMKDAISLLGHTALMIYDDEYIVNQRVGLIRAENEIGIDYPFLYLLTNDEVFIANLRGRANSGVQVNLTTKSIKESPFVIPNKQTNTSFNKVVKPLFEKIKYNAQQIQTLQQTRDTLLPKLMSANLRVDEFKE